MKLSEFGLFCIHGMTQGHAMNIKSEIFYFPTEIKFANNL